MDTLCLGLTHMNTLCLTLEDRVNMSIVQW